VVKKLVMMKKLKKILKKATRNQRRKNRLKNMVFGLATWLSLLRKMVSVATLKTVVKLLESSVPKVKVDKNKTKGNIKKWGDEKTILTFIFFYFYLGLPM
jgi:hypothetical protein